MPYRLSGLNLTSGEASVRRRFQPPPLPALCISSNRIAAALIAPTAQTISPSSASSWLSEGQGYRSVVTSELL